MISPNPSTGKIEMVRFTPDHQAVLLLSDAPDMETAKRLAEGRLLEDIKQEEQAPTDPFLNQVYRFQREARGATHAEAMREVERRAAERDKGNASLATALRGRLKALGKDPDQFERDFPDVQERRRVVASMEEAKIKHGPPGKQVGDRIEYEAWGPGVVIAHTDRSITIRLDDGQELNIQTGTPGYDRIRPLRATT